MLTSVARIHVNWNNYRNIIRCYYFYIRQNNFTAKLEKLALTTKSLDSEFMRHQQALYKLLRCIHVYIHTYIITYIHTNTHTYLHTMSCTYIREYTRTIHSQTRIHACIAGTYAQSCMHINIHIYTCKYANTNIHTYTVLQTYIYIFHTVTYIKHA